MNALGLDPCRNSSMWPLINSRGRLAIAGGMLVCLSACASVGQRSSASRDSIRELLSAQVSAWNRGDIDAFMQTYWNSEDLTFSSGGKTKRGYRATLEGYKERYPTPQRMGKLEFSDLEIRLLNDNAALVLGRWHLDRQPDAVGGNFSLVLQRLDGHWKIVHDHTSAEIPPPDRSPAEPSRHGG